MMKCVVFVVLLFLLGFASVDQSSSRSYTVIIITGYYETRSRVDIRFVGDLGTSLTHRLVPWPPGNYFKRRSKNVFRGIKDRDVGVLKYVDVYLSPGSSSKWSLNKILVISNGGQILTFENDYNDVSPGRWTRYKVSCPFGTEKGPDGSCVDKDECKNSPCTGPTAKCMNTVGSYECKCSKGYHIRYGTRCEDINECLAFNECSEYCINTQGSYKCGCRSAGYRLVKGKECVDINECEEGSDNCDRPSTYCSNVKGGFYCYCNPGYEHVNSTYCKVRYCGSLSIYAGKTSTVSPPRCLTDKGSRYKDTCTLVCKYGYEVMDPKLVTITCGGNGYWKGGFSYCRGVKCPPVASITNGFTIPSICSTTGGRHGDSSNCNQYCNGGYRNIGGKTFVCQANGTWSGSPAICKKVYPDPWIDCPFSIFVVLPLGKNRTSLGSKWKLPRHNVNNITVSPSWANQFYEFPYGQTRLTWTATNGDGKKKSCQSTIVVQDKESPKVSFCPGPRIFQPAYNISFFVKYKKPSFTDNVGVASVSPKYKGGIQMKYRSHYYQTITARDQSGNYVKCKFEIISGGSRCSLHPDGNGYPGRWTYILSSYKSRSSYRTCPRKTMSYGTWGIYHCDESTGIWKPSKVADCVGVTKVNTTMKCPEGSVRSPVLYQSKDICLQCPMGNYYKSVSGNGTCVKCPPGTYQDKRGSTSCKTCPQGTSSLQEEHVCRDLCPRGTFSKDGMRPFCSLCPQGQYQPKEGQTSCLDCQTFTNTKLGSFSCEGVKPPSNSKDLPVIERIVKPRVLNLTSSEAANVFECYIKDNNYEQVAVKWEVMDKGIPADFLGSIRHEEIRNDAGKLVGARMIITRTERWNAYVKYACNAINANGQTQSVVMVPLQSS